MKLAVASDELLPKIYKIAFLVANMQKPSRSKQVELVLSRCSKRPYRPLQIPHLQMNSANVKL